MEMQMPLNHNSRNLFNLLVLEAGLDIVHSYEYHQKQLRSVGHIQWISCDCCMCVKKLTPHN